MQEYGRLRRKVGGAEEREKQIKRRGRDGRDEIEGEGKVGERAK